MTVLAHFPSTSHAAAFSASSKRWRCITTEAAHSKGTCWLRGAARAVWRVKMESIKQQRVKLLAAAAIGSGLVAIGAVAAVSQQQTGTVAISPMNIGGTATTTTPPPVEPTPAAQPADKAPRPRGF